MFSSHPFLWKRKRGIDMSTRIKPLQVISSFLIFISAALGQSAHAQGTLIELGSSTLANSLGTSVGPETLVVSWAVFDNSVSDVYTYYYNVSNPANDVLLNPNGGPTSTPESVDSFQVAFNAAGKGALLGPPAGGALASSDATGVSWYFFPTIAAGGSSGILSFQSDFGPGLGNAAANGANPPGPWSTAPNGQPVPIPHVTPEPGILYLMGMSALLVLPFRSSLRRSAHLG
jgi:hypothetical protein